MPNGATGGKRIEIKVGYYTEIAFPEAEVRFIAINNGS